MQSGRPTGVLSSFKKKIPLASLENSNATAEKGGKKDEEEEEEEEERVPTPKELQRIHDRDLAYGKHKGDREKLARVRASSAVRGSVASLNLGKKRAEEL